MGTPTMGAVEARFADMIWAAEPITAVELARRCEKEFSWKKSTTYTVLKRLCDKNIFRNDGGTVTSLLSRDDFYAAQSEEFIDSTFGGSLPAFIAAFSRRKTLSDAEIDALRRMIDEYGEK